MTQSYGVPSLEALAIISKLTEIFHWQCAWLIANGRQFSSLLIVYKLIFNTRATSGGTASIKPIQYITWHIYHDIYAIYIMQHLHVFTQSICMPYRLLNNCAEFLAYSYQNLR